MNKLLKSITTFAIAILVILPVSVFAENFTLTFDAKGGKFADNSEKLSVNVEAGDVLGEIEKPKQNGKVFLCWSEDGIGCAILNNYYVFDNKDFDAIWISEDKYITSVNINVVLPEVGTTVVKETIEDPEYHFEYEESNPKPTLNLNSGAHFTGMIYWASATGTDDDQFSGKIIAGNYYYALVDLTADEGYYFAEDLMVNSNGTVKLGDYVNGEFRGMIVKVKAVKLEILKGNNSIVDPSKNLEIIASGNINSIKTILIDGQECDIDAFFAKGNSEGNTVITINKNKLSNLSAGKHKVTFVYNDGEVSATIIVPTYTVTFNTNGGSKVDSQKVKAGKLLSQPTDPKKDGYEFFGWYLDENYEVEYDFTKPITKDTTLYALFIKTINILGDDEIEYTKKSNSDLTIKTDGDYNYFESVEIDMDTLDKKYYTVLKSDKGTDITIKADYLDTLSSKKHDIFIGFTDENDFMGYGYAQLTIKEEDEKVVVPEVISNNEEDIVNPNTSDDIIIYAALLLLSIPGFVLVKKYN